MNWYVQLSDIARKEGVTVDQAYRLALHDGKTAPISQSVKMGIADVFKTVLMLDKRRGMIGGLTATRWYPTDKTPVQVDPFASFANSNEIKDQDF